MNRFTRLISSANEKMMLITGVFMIVMAVAVTYDVVMRYVFNAPTEWSFEFNCYMCAAIGFLSGGYCLSKRGHVNVDILYMRFQPRVKGIVDCITSVFFFLLCFVLIRYGLDIAIHSIETGGHSGGGLNPPLGLVQMLVPIGGIFIGLQGIVKFISDLLLALGKE